MSSDDSTVEDSILELLNKHPNGITNKVLQNAMPSTGPAQLVDALNKLTAADKIQILNKGSQLMYKLKDQESARICRGADLEDKLIYQIIEKAGSKGIWIRDLRFESNLPQTQVNKILKSLESKKLIKSVKSVAAAKKKVYMLYNIEPDRSVTGGTWYSDQEFESEFVDVLNQQCFRYLTQAKIVADKLSDPVSQRNASYKSSKDVCNYINGLKVSKMVCIIMSEKFGLMWTERMLSFTVEGLSVSCPAPTVAHVQLSLQDIETILDTLIYDGKVEKSVVERGSTSSDTGRENLYRVIKPLVHNCGLMRVPCGVCPVHSECREGGVISPATCPYMKEWLEF